MLNGCFLAQSGQVSPQYNGCPNLESNAFLQIGQIALYLNSLLLLILLTINDFSISLFVPLKITFCVFKAKKRIVPYATSKAFLVPVILNQLPIRKQAQKLTTFLYGIKFPIHFQNVIKLHNSIFLFHNGKNIVN